MLERGGQAGERSIDSRISIQNPARLPICYCATPSGAVCDAERAHVGDGGKNVAEDEPGVWRGEVTRGVICNERVDMQLGEPLERAYECAKCAIQNVWVSLGQVDFEVQIIDFEGEPFLFCGVTLKIVKNASFRGL